MADYQKIIALTQGVSGQKAKKLNKTNRTVPKKIADDRIVVTQGDYFLKELELLTTKVKATKERQEEESDYFTSQF